jgi:hypothetical protein
MAAGRVDVVGVRVVEPDAAVAEVAELMRAGPRITDTE